MATAEVGGDAGYDEDGRSRDRLPDSADPRGRCPRCVRVSDFSVQLTEAISFTGEWVSLTARDRYRDFDQRVVVMECNSCRQNIVVIEDRYIGGDRRGRDGPVTWRGTFWWPTPSDTVTTTGTVRG
jgi:hypothetical protein